MPFMYLNKYYYYYYYYYYHIKFSTQPRVWNNLHQVHSKPK